MRAILQIPETFAHLTAPTRGSVVLAISTLVALLASAFGLAELRTAQLDARMVKSQSIVEAAVNVTWFYYNQFMNAKMTESEARGAALTTISHMTYGSANNYVFVYSYEKPGEYTLQVNRVRPDLVGVNRYDAVSSDGVKYVQAGVSLAKSGGGFYSYKWDAGGASPRPRLKVSYAEGFAPWHLMIGTGDYVDDILTEFWDRFSFLLSFAAICIARSEETRLNSSHCDLSRMPSSA